MKMKRTSINTTLQFAQLLVMGIGVFTIAIQVGRKDQLILQASQDIESLENISSDLVRASIESASTDQYHRERIDALRERILFLEQSMRGTT